MGSEKDAGVGAHSARYVRQRPAHRTVEPIDDLAQADDGPEVITHDSGYTVPGGVMSGRSYRRSRARGRSCAATSTMASTSRSPRAGATSSPHASGRRASSPR